MYNVLNNFENTFVTKGEIAHDFKSRLLQRSQTSSACVERVDTLPADCTLFHSSKVSASGWSLLITEKNNLLHVIHMFKFLAANAFDSIVSKGEQRHINTRDCKCLTENKILQTASGSSHVIKPRDHYSWFWKWPRYLFCCQRKRAVENCFYTSSKLNKVDCLIIIDVYDIY